MEFHFLKLLFRSLSKNWKPKLQILILFYFLYCRSLWWCYHVINRIIGTSKSAQLLLSVWSVILLKSECKRTRNCFWAFYRQISSLHVMTMTLTVTNHEVRWTNTIRSVTSVGLISSWVIFNILKEWSKDWVRGVFNCLAGYSFRCFIQ